MESKSNIHRKTLPPPLKTRFKSCQLPMYLSFFFTALGSNQRPRSLKHGRAAVFADISPCFCGLRNACFAATGSCNPYEAVNSRMRLWKHRVVVQIQIEENNKRSRSYDLLLLLAPPVGLEPTTLRLTAACSTD